MQTPCFSDLYCGQQRIQATAYDRHLFHRALYPHAQPVAWLLDLCSRRYFEADREFVEDLSRLTRFADFFGVGMDYNRNSLNARFLRRVLRLRISTGRMQRIVLQTLQTARSGKNSTGGNPAPVQAPSSPLTGPVPGSEQP